MSKTQRLLISMLTLLCCTGAWAEGELNGKFTINASGDKVQFSRGNLQATYDGSDWSWAFATNQWDYISNTAANTSINGNGTVSTNGTVDLFGWVGASSTWEGAAQYGISNSSATGSTNGYGANGSEGLKSDWGNTIGTGWRTLTKNEWAYVFYTRTTTSNIRYAMATVNGKAGFILLPDDWSSSYYTLASTNTNNAAYTTNSIDESTWTTSLEAHGAVFLPAAGYREGSTVNGVGAECCYWSSTASYSTGAYSVRLGSGNLGPEISNTRKFGFSVRLVKNYTLQQDAEGNYLIGSVQDWKDFAALVNGGTNNVNAKMTADIDLGAQITMIASDFDHPYQGTFDGQGHTLTVNWTTNGEDRIAPFRYAEGATIKKLHVDGSISKTDAQGRCPAGILACSIGSATTTITECWSSVSLYAFDTIGGLFCVACGNSTTNIIDCVFSGTISASHSWGHSGGFASHADKTYLYNTEGAPTVNITRGLNLGTFSGGTTETYTFIRADANAVYGTHTVNSCYYKNVYGHAQGTQATTAELVNGTTATALQSSRAEAVWVQDPVTNQPMLAIFANGVTLTDGDNLSALETFAGKTCRVAYSRSFTEAKSSTVCLPFAFAKGSVGTFYTFTDIHEDGGEYIADMTEYTGDYLVANTPYLFTPSATGSVDFSGTYEIPASITAGETVSGDWTYLGTYETIEWTSAPTGIYGFSAQAVAEQGISQGQFVKVGEYVRVKPMRCYLKYKNGTENYAKERGMNRTAGTDEQLPETIKVRLIGANGHVTAIGTLQTKTGEVTLDSDVWYTLDGIRIKGKPTAKGVYVNNKKKVAIK